MTVQPSLALGGPQPAVFAGGDAAGGCTPLSTPDGPGEPSAADRLVQLLRQSGQLEAVPQAADRDSWLEKVLQEVQRDLNERTLRAEEEKRAYLESTRNLKGSIRILGRIRPALAGEEEDVGCLRVLNKQQLEVLTEPRALLTGRSRRGTTGSIPSSLAPNMSMRSSSIISEADSTQNPDSRTFPFDDLFGTEATDDDVFTAVHDELVAAVNGEAVCIIAYGATGSGKTHTVKNLAERTAQELERQAVSLAQGGVVMEITVQIVELYNGQLRDLLASDSSVSAPPRLKLSVSGSITALLGAASRTIRSDMDGGIALGLGEALRLGQAQRATSATAIHGRSSRSHLVMTLMLQMREAATGAFRQAGKLSFVDLAGSERLKRSEVVGERAREAQHINRSLSALVDVISAKERRDSHVPYRNSKLTQLLQDALGGQQQCRTVVIVALPPTRSNLADTMHSLQFSSRLTALALVPISSRRSLARPTGQFGNEAGQGQFLSPTPEGTDRAKLKREVLKWQTECDRAQAELEDCRRQMEHKDAQLKEVVRQNAELLATSHNFERSRAQLLDGFVALNQRLQDVEAATLPEPAKSSMCSSGAHQEDSSVPQTSRPGLVQEAMRPRSVRKAPAPAPTLRTSQSARSESPGRGGSSAACGLAVPSWPHLEVDEFCGRPVHSSDRPVRSCDSAHSEQPRTRNGNRWGSPVNRRVDGEPWQGAPARLNVAPSRAVRSASTQPVENWSSIPTWARCPALAGEDLSSSSKGRGPLVCRVTAARSTSPVQSLATRRVPAGASWGRAAPVPAAKMPSKQEEPATPSSSSRSSSPSESPRNSRPVNSAGPCGPLSFDLSPLRERQTPEEDRGQKPVRASSPPRQHVPPSRPQGSSPREIPSLSSSWVMPSVQHRSHPSSVPVFALTPCKEHAVDEPVPSWPRARSPSLQRRSPRTYAVEVISEARARQLDMELPPSSVAAPKEVSPRANASPPCSPALLLFPQEPEGEGSVARGESSEVGLLDAATAEVCDDTISVSSDEGVIRDRLKKSLEFQLQARRAPVSARKPVTAAPPPVAAPPRIQPRGRRPGSPLAAVTSPHTSRSPQHGAPAGTAYTGVPGVLRTCSPRSRQAGAAGGSPRWNSSGVRPVVQRPALPVSSR